MAETQMVVVQKAMSEQELRVQLARDLKELKTNPPDRAKVRGGRYVLADGRIVDANGKEITGARGAAASEGTDDPEHDDESSEESGDSTAPKAGGSTAKKGAAKKGGR